MSISRHRGKCHNENIKKFFSLIEDSERNLDERREKLWIIISK